MAFRVFVTICVVALALHSAESRNAEEDYVKTAVPCLNDWWKTNKHVLLEHPANQHLKIIMEQMSVESLSDPWMQLALDTALTNVEKRPQTKKIGRSGLVCIECLRQLVDRPRRCN